MDQAARSTRVSSKEPSTGTSPATLTIAVKDSRPSTAMASSSCSSLQPASDRLLVEVVRNGAALVEDAPCR